MFPELLRRISEEKGPTRNQLKALHITIKQKTFAQEKKAKKKKICDRCGSVFV